MVLCCLFKFYIVLNGFEFYSKDLYCLVQSFMVLYGLIWYCMIICSVVWSCLKKHTKDFPQTLLALCIYSFDNLLKHILKPIHYQVLIYYGKIGSALVLVSGCFDYIFSCVITCFVTNGLADSQTHGLTLRFCIVF